MSALFFTTAAQLKKLIDDYFTYIEGDYYEAEKPGDEGKEAPRIDKVWNRHPEPATFTGLAFFLGFSSRQMFDNYCDDGEFANAASRGHLRVQMFYEKKLHGPSATGAIYALKNAGWTDKPEPVADKEAVIKTLQIKFIEAGLKVASNEKEIDL